MSNESEQVAGYVPSAEAVRLAGESLEDDAMRWLGRDLGTTHRDDMARNAIAAAVPVEVARVLWQLRVLVDRWSAPDRSSDDKHHAECLRLVLDTVGVPAQVDEAATGGQCEVTDLDPCPWHPDGGNHPATGGQS